MKQMDKGNQVATRELNGEGGRSKEMGIYPSQETWSLCSDTPRKADSWYTPVVHIVLMTNVDESDSSM